VLRGLALHVDLPRHVFAKEYALGRLDVRNTRRWLPSLSVSLVPPRNEGKRAMADRTRHLRIPTEASAGAAMAARGISRIRRVPDAPLAPSVFRWNRPFCFDPAAVFRQIRDRALFPAPWLSTAQDAFALVTVFPFGLLVKRRSVDVAHELIVYPAVECHCGNSQSFSLHR